MEGTIRRSSWSVQLTVHQGRNAKGEEGLFPATYITEQDAAPPSPRHSAHNLSNPPSPKGGNAQLATIPIPAESESPRGGASPAFAQSSPSLPPTNGPMGGTIDTVQRAIDEQAAKPIQDDHGLGIGQDARARLAAQAKLANEQREKQRISGGVSGLVYSDESEDEEDDDNDDLEHPNGINGNSVIPKPVDPAPLSSSVAPANKLSPIAQSAPSSSQIPQAPAVPDSAAPDFPSSATRSLEPAFPLPSTPPTASVRSGSVASKPPSAWTIDDVVSWARAKGFDELVCSKFIGPLCAAAMIDADRTEHEITGDLLLDLDVNLLKELDIPQFGKRLRIAQAIAEIRRPASVVSGTSQAPPLSPGMAPPAGFTGRGLSAPPSADSQRSSVTPPSSSPVPDAGGSQHSVWSHGRKVSASALPTSMAPIKEGQTAPVLAPVSTGVPSVPSAPSTATTNPRSLPTTPTTTATMVSKRESGGSIGHKKGKSSVDSKDRLSFFGRSRKPAPAASPDQRNLSRLSGSNNNRMHEVTPASPNRRQSSTSASANGAVGDGQAMALKQIGKPDYSGFLKKKGERYGTWKMRYFVLKGAHLYYMKSESDDRVKGHIEVKGSRVIVDENTNPGSYGFRLMGLDKQHSFSSPEQAVVRGWMKALMKATIARDYSVAVTSSCNIPTISLAEAQALAPRPPSPATRDATQRATRRENTNTLTAHDANILASAVVCIRALTLTPADGL